MNNQKSYAAHAAVGQKPLTQPISHQTFQFTAEQLTKFVANVVIQIAQPQASYPNLVLSNHQNDTLATICCQNGNPNFLLFQSINNLSADVMFVGDFNSKLESFGCARKNPSGPMLKNIQKQLHLIYLNNDEHMHMGRAKGSTDILDMAFISLNLAKHYIQFQIGDDLGGHHLPIEISIGTPHIGTHLLTTPSKNLTRLTEKYSNQHSRKCYAQLTFLDK